MKIKYICGGTLDRIPKINDRMPLTNYIEFQIDSYGATEEIESTLYDTGKMYTMILEGHLVVKKGSPMEILELILEGKFEEAMKR